jgi:hypothetical protein
MNMPMTTLPLPLPARRGNRALRFFGWALLAAIVIIGVLVMAAIASAVTSMEPGFIQINGQPLNLGDLDAGEWVVGIGGILVAISVVLLVVLLVVPLAVLIPAGLALFGIVVAVAAVAGAALLALSPLIMLVGGIWLVVRLLRGNERKRQEANTQANHGATIAR